MVATRCATGDKFLNLSGVNLFCEPGSQRLPVQVSNPDATPLLFEM